MLGFIFQHHGSHMGSIIPELIINQQGWIAATLTPFRLLRIHQQFRRVFRDGKERIGDHQRLGT